MTGADLYLVVSERLLRLRTEREVAMREEGAWTEILETFWDDLDEAGREAVEAGLRLPERRALIGAGVEYQKQFVRPT